jgi:hypothetical protein
LVVSRGLFAIIMRIEPPISPYYPLGQFFSLDLWFKTTALHPSQLSEAMACSLQVTYEMVGRSHGLLEKSFAIRNLSNPQQEAVPVHLRLFVDPGCLEVAAGAAAGPEPDKVVLGDIPVVVTEEGQVRVSSPGARLAE